MKSRGTKSSIGAYAVQCCKCFKWRLIPSQEEYENIRHSFLEVPWFCSKSHNISCDDPIDIEYDSSQLWVIDKPNIPKTPPKFERCLIMRRNFSKLDAYYYMPNGKKMRTLGEIEKFLQAHPEYKDKVSLSSFSFTTPKIMENMIPRDIEQKASASGSKRKQISTPDDN